MYICMGMPSKVKDQDVVNYFAVVKGYLPLTDGLVAAEVMKGTTNANTFFGQPKKVAKQISKYL